MRTGQLWKVYVFWCGFLSCACLFVAFLGSTGETTPPYASLGAAFFLVGSAAYAWLFVSLRCPVCLHRPAWWYFRKGILGDWYRSVIEMSECPICQDRGFLSTPAWSKKATRDGDQS
jgi:hypothetical protein